MSRAAAAAGSGPSAGAGFGTPSRLPERPPISRPGELPRPTPDAVAARRGRGRARFRLRLRALDQPHLGLAGLLLVVPNAVVLALAAGADGSVLVLSPLVLYALPVVTMVAFWWEDWPGTRLRPSWSGWVDTVLIAAGAVVLTGLGQVVAGGLDLAALFDSSPGPGSVPTFPATLPLAGAAFVTMLQLTLVGEGWPLRNLPRLPAGVAALAVSWAVALVVDLVLVEVRPPPGSGVTARRDGPVPGEDLAAVLLVIGACQVLFYVVWRGWPFSTIRGRATRLLSAHLGVVGTGILAYLAGHELLGIDPPRLATLAGCFVTGGLAAGMLLEGWPATRRRAGTGAGAGGDVGGKAGEGAGEATRVRAVVLLAALVMAALLAVLLAAGADGLPLRRVTTDEWMRAALNALGVSIILHVAVGRRWPFAAPPSPSTRGLSG